MTTGDDAIADHLIAEHVADQLGHCRTGAVGAQKAHHTWPCSIYGHAVRAREVERRRDRPGDAPPDQLDAGPAQKEASPRSR